MEKLRKYRNFIKCSGFLRLLTVLAFVLTANSIYAQTQGRLTYAIIKELEITPVNERNYCGEEVCYELKIPYIRADDVMAAIPDLPNGVSFVSLRRSEYSDTTTGTKIELWLNFAEPGKYKFRVMRLTLNGRLYGIPLKTIEIFENPKNMLPQLVVSFDNGTELIQQRRTKAQTKPAFQAEKGTLLTFHVSLQYAVQILNYEWQVPKNALLEETERFEITKGTLRNSEFSVEKIPVATFEWEPLVTGQVYLPELRITATAYNGSRVELTMPEAFVDVVSAPKEAAKVEDIASEYFAYAFTPVPETVKAYVKKSVTEGDCRRLAALRAAERKSLPFGKAKIQRKELEKSLEINGEINEPAFYRLVIFLSLTLIFTVLLLIALAYKKIPSVLVLSIFAILFFVLSIISIVFLHQKYGIFTGGGVSPVPEKTVEAVESIESGRRVRIEQKAGGWLFIRVGSSGGWVLEQNVIMIE